MKITASPSPKPRSLYVHIPFCRKICPYCNFPKVLLSTGFATHYVEQLLKEDERYANYRFDTIFLGGGTPSVLASSALTTLLTTLIARHGQPQELTVECNPEDLDEALVKTLVANGCNRVSLGVQTADDAALQTLGRNHTFKDAIAAVQRCHAAGLTNISVDFIYGLPGQTLTDIARDLTGIETLKYLTHVSFYALQVEKNTVYGIKGVQTPASDLLADMYELILAGLAKYGFARYEISNFAQPSYQCQHNLCYWRALPYAALGMGATGYEDGWRETRNRSITAYLQGQFLHGRENESLATQEFNYLMLNLRLVEGFSLTDFKKRFGKDFLCHYQERIDNVKDWLIIGDDRVKVVPKYLYVLDEILLELLDFDSLKRQ